MKSLVILFSLLMVFVLAGCGGNGGGHSTPSVFQGAFDGTWTATNSSNGTTAIEIDQKGDFSGSFVNLTQSITGTITGHINSNGTFTGTITLQGNDFDGTGTFVLSNNDQDLDGTFTYQGTTYTFDLTATLV